MCRDKLPMNRVVGKFPIDCSFPIYPIPLPGYQLQGYHLPKYTK